MTYLDYLNRFNQWLESNALPAHSQLMYFKLLNVFNRAGWPDTVQVDNRRMEMMLDGAAKTTVIRAREKLVSAGFIRYSRGTKGKPNRYALVGIGSICATFSATENATENATFSATESATENATHIKTKNKTKKKKEGNTGPEPLQAPGPPAASVLLNDKSLFDVPQEQAARWQALFPAVDVPQELRKITAWCEANPQKRKTRGGVVRFITAWLSREQDRGGSRPAVQGGAGGPKAYDIDELEAMSVFNLPEGL